MWAHLLSIHAIHLSNYIMKYWLLIGAIRLMHNFAVDCARQWTGLDAHFIFIYGNVLLHFLEWARSIVPFSVFHY